MALFELPQDRRKRNFFLVACGFVVAAILGYSLGIIKGEFAALIICLQ